MKKTILLVLLAAFLTGCGASPEWIVRDYLRAIEEKDEGAIKDMYCDSGSGEVSNFDEIDYIKTRSIKIDQKKKSGSSAEVELSGEMKMKFKDDDDATKWTDFETTFSFDKDGGKWCIDYTTG